MRLGCTTLIVALGLRCHSKIQAAFTPAFTEPMLALRLGVSINAFSAVALSVYDLARIDHICAIVLVVLLLVDIVCQEVCLASGVV